MAGTQGGAFARVVPCLVTDCSILSPAHEAGHPPGGTSGEEAPQCGCWGDSWGRVLAKRAQPWEEEGETAARLAACLRPCAGHPRFGLGLVSSCVTTTTFQELLCRRVGSVLRALHVLALFSKST